MGGSDTTSRVVAIGLDAGERRLLDRWIDAGKLPNLQRVRDAGTYVPLRNRHYCVAEAAWHTFLFGQWPEKHHFWTEVQYDPATYAVDEARSPADGCPPFYAHLAGYKVAIVDVPRVRLVEGLPGIQLLGWGAHGPAQPRVSRPPHLHAEIVSRYGEHPTFCNDFAPLWNRRELERVRRGLLAGIRRRGAMVTDLLARDRWNLFLTVFSEPHTAGHLYWHLSHSDHPLYRPGQEDILLEIYQAIDEEIGRIAGRIDSDTHLMIFAAHGMEANHDDLPNMVMLPEALYRNAFPSQCGMPNGIPGSPVPRPPRLLLRAWAGEVWSRRHDTNPFRRALRRMIPMGPFARLERILGTAPGPINPTAFGRLSYQAPLWWSPFWPQMKAFALPTFSDGNVRVNVRGREAQGIVEPSDFALTLDEVEELLSELVDARTGRRLEPQFVRMRSGAHDRGTGAPADLVVLWREVFDAVESRRIGRIGPFPFNRSGGHSARGFVFASGPRIPAGRQLPEADVVDLAATILDLLGAPIPGDLDGQPLALTASRAARGPESAPMQPGSSVPADRSSR